MSLATVTLLVALTTQLIGGFPGTPEPSQLSADDRGQIERLARGRFWLLIRQGSDFEVYRLPENTGTAVRRGPMAWVSWSPPSRLADTPTWQTPPLPFPKLASWAQVALPGRTFDDVAGPQDVNRPFRVAGVFRDAELVSLVEFIRSGPELRDAIGTRSVIRGLPIVSVERKEDGRVDLWLRISEAEGQIVWVKPAGDGWSLVNTLHAIA